MSGELTHIQRRLAAEGEKTASFFASLSDEDWEQPVYTTGSRWQVKQVLAHFVSTERAYQNYIRNFLSGGDGPPSDLDIDAFNDAEAPALSLAQSASLIENYRQARLDTLLLTQELVEEDLGRMGTHPWFGEKDLGWYLKLLYRHNTMHLQDVRKALETGRVVPHTDAHRTGRQITPPSP